MEHYVTLFDSLFLPQGLALRSSLERHAGPYTLWVLCVDDAAFEVLQKLALPNLRPLSIEQVLTDELRRIKPSRTRAEWCWTLTPFTPKFVFDADPTAQRVTYLDADVWLTQDPRPVFDEFEASGKAVLITEHAYAPDHDQSHTSGRFCVQFMVFARDRSESVRAWWADRCIEWCYARQEDGKFGDQKYLDDWPLRFAEYVHVLRNLSLLQAPWNATRFAPGDAVAYHFHGLRTLRGGQVLLTTVDYRLPQTTVAQIYRPYSDDLSRACTLLKEAGVSLRPQLDTALSSLWWQHHRARLGARLRSLFPPLFMQI
jgi:hypothetical protein